MLKKNISDTELGRRLSIARKIAGKNIDESAAAISLSAHSLKSVENGSKSINFEELLSLASFYETSASRILCTDAVHADLIPRFRNMQQTEDRHTFEAAKLLNRCFSAEVELERLLRIEHCQNFIYEYVISEGNIRRQATQQAIILRDSLGIGNAPIADIFSLIEEDLGIRLYQCQLEKTSKVLGVYGFDKELGACILLNTNYSRPHRSLSAAHELGHFICSRENMEVLDEDCLNSSNDELFAINFSYALTMPEDEFKDSYTEVADNPGDLSKKIVIELANKFHVSSIACLHRLEDLGLVQKNDDWCNTVKGINCSDEEKVLGPEQMKIRYAENIGVHPTVPYKICVMIHQAWNRMLLSEGQICNLLRLRRIEARKIINEIEMEEPNFDDLFKQRT